MKASFFPFFAVLLATSLLTKTHGAGDAPARVPDARPPARERLFVSHVVEDAIQSIAERMKDDALAQIFRNALPNTLDTTVHYTAPSDGKEEDTFVVTGDIHAMWLRDSTNQVWPYLRFARKDAHLASMLRGVVRRQTVYILTDAYANAFLKDRFENPSPWVDDSTSKRAFAGTRASGMTKPVFERKYELDSLCAFLKLSRGVFDAGIAKDALGPSWRNAVERVLEVMREQQQSYDEEGSDPAYIFQRQAYNPTDTLIHGRGAPTKRTGMIRSAFRPSDDSCTFPFLVPANAMAVVELRHAARILRKMHDQKLADGAEALAAEVQTGIEKYAVREHSSGDGEVYAYEVDGFGNAYFADDANVPSLLSLPLLGYTSSDDALYNRTRSLVWSQRNPYFFRSADGKQEGIGGPHNGPWYIWPMSQVVRALTAETDKEIADSLVMLREGARATGLLHESFAKDSTASYTRAWFAWCNSLFGELILSLADSHPHLIFKDGGVSPRLL